MYGSEKSDLVVKYYDQSFGLIGDQEIAWYLQKADMFGGPVLDLACGTGRLAIRLAERGYTVTGIDQSMGMLQQFRKKLKVLHQSINQRIQIIHTNMAGFALDARFNMILCCDGFFHNLTVEDQIRCLTSVNHHLTSNGIFVFNLPNPTSEFILKAEKSKGTDFEERGRYPISGSSDILVVEQAQDGDEFSQTIKTIMRISRINAHGQTVEYGESSWTTRYLYQNEAVHLLYRCGLAVESLVGDYMDNPVSKGSQLIFQVKKRIFDDG